MMNNKAAGPDDPPAELHIGTPQKGKRAVTKELRRNMNKNYRWASAGDAHEQGST